MISALSASQLKTFLACPRKWGFEKIDGQPRTSSPSADLGTRVHTILEDWLRAGTPPSLSETFVYQDKSGNTVTRYPGQIAHAGLHLLPAPMTPGLEIEGWLSLRTKAGPWTGRLDLRYRDVDGTAVVHDHKTTSSAAYALTPETLRTDPQALLYAASEMVRLGVDRVRLDWLYLPTASRSRAWKVSLPVLRDEIAPDLDRLEETAALMWATARSGLTGRDVPANPGACHDFGGCDYLLTCNRTPQDLLQGFDTMNHPDAKTAMDQLMGLLGGAPPPPPPPAPDIINPPEAPPISKDLPPVAPPVVSDVIVVPPDGYKAMDRTALKTLAVQRGLLAASAKQGKDAIVRILEDDDRGVIAPAPPPPPPAPLAFVDTPAVSEVPPPPPPVVPEPPSASDLAGPPPARVPTVSSAVVGPDPKPVLTKDDRDFWTAVYLEAVRHGHETPVTVADGALKARVLRFAGVS